MEIQEKHFTKLFPWTEKMTDIQFFRFNMLFDFLVFLPILVMIPLTGFAFLSQFYYKTLENPFYVSYAIIRIFLFFMIFFIVVFQYSIMLGNVFKEDFSKQTNVLLRYTVELVVFLFFFAWSIYLGVNFFRLLEKHREYYDDNVSIGEDQDDLYFDRL